MSGLAVTRLGTLLSTKTSGKLNRSLDCIPVVKAMLEMYTV